MKGVARDGGEFEAHCINTLATHTGNKFFIFLEQILCFHANQKNVFFVFKDFLLLN